MQSKRYALLDGIRGVAAIIVLTRHTDSFWNWVSYRGYLAVDLFFILSGFVIAYAYDEKLRNGTISIREFFLIRLIRLYPIYILSVVVCFSLFVIDAAYQNKLNHAEMLDAAGLFIFSGLFFPYIKIGTPLLFPLNIPYWSLFFELVANFSFAIFRPLLNNIVLFYIIAIFGSILVAVSISHGSVDVGFSWGWKSILAGFSRSMFGVFAGLLLFRNRELLLRRYFFEKVPPWSAAIMIVVVLLSPSLGLANPLVDILILWFVFPVCVLAASQYTSKKGEALLIALGSASYPIYVFHKPVGEIVSYVLNGAERAYVPFSGIILVAALVRASLWLEKNYDIPVRKWMSEHLLRRIKASKISV